jgi:2-polyprenyl-3-methyl-5-hydroxy-6-metoxy-1,4-benzoquinol methylase
MHLGENDLTSPMLECPFCGSKDRKNIIELQKNPIVNLLQCNRCFAISASRVPNNETLRKYYSNYYTTSHLNVTINNPNRLAGHIFKYINKCINKDHINILDFGGGDGGIAIAIAKMFLEHGSKSVNILLIDYSECPTYTGDSRICISKASNLNIAIDSKYDIIIASSIIEHLVDPISDLKQLFSMLDMGGIFYARTPYVIPIMKIFLRLNRYFDFTYPGHLHDLGSKFWNNFFDNVSIDGEYTILRSRPSIVETSLDQDALRTILAYILKLPGHVFHEYYNIVGGWEVFIIRN